MSPPKNKSWKSVYIRTPNPDKPGQYKWTVVGKMYGYGTKKKNWSLEWIK